MRVKTRRTEMKKKRLCRRRKGMTGFIFKFNYHIRHTLKMRRLKKLAQRSSRSKSPSPAMETIPRFEFDYNLNSDIQPQSQHPTQSHAEARDRSLAHCPNQPHSRPLTQPTRASSRPDPACDDDDDDDDDVAIPAPPSAVEQPLLGRRISTEEYSEEATQTTSGSGSGSGSRSGSGCGQKRTRVPNQSLETPQNSEHRLFLTPLGNSSFKDSKGVRTISNLIKQHYSEPWSTWKRVPNEVKAQIWHKFQVYHFEVNKLIIFLNVSKLITICFSLQEKFRWSVNQTNNVYTIWEYLCKSCFRDLLQLERRKAMQYFNTDKISDCKGYKSKWISVQIWDQLVENEWGTERSEKSKKGKQNRIGMITKYASDSVSFSVHEYRMAQSLGRAPTYKELFDRTHRRVGGDGDYVDNKSKSVSKKYATSLTQKYDEDISTHPHFDRAAWCEVIGGIETMRTHTYGFGTRPHHLDLQMGTNSVSTQSSCASHSVDDPFTYPTPGVIGTPDTNSEMQQVKDDVRVIMNRFDNLEGKLSDFMDQMMNFMARNANNIGALGLGPSGSGGHTNQ